MLSVTWIDKGTRWWEFIWPRISKFEAVPTTHFWGRKTQFQLQLGPNIWSYAWYMLVTKIGHVMMTPLQSPHTLVLLLACFTKIFQQSGSNANDRLVTIHINLSQRDFESYKEHKTTKRIGTWNQSWYVAFQNRHVLHTNFTSKTCHQNPGIRVLFIRITHLFVIKVIRPNNADCKSPRWYFRQKKTIISLQ